MILAARSISTFVRRHPVKPPGGAAIAFKSEGSIVFSTHALEVNRPGAAALLAGCAVVKGVTLGLALRSRRDGWEGSRGRAPTALEQGREGADRRRDAVQEQLKRDPHCGDLYIFRGRRGDLAKILWHDGLGLSLYAKRLDRGKFIWPSAKGGVVSISAGQMAYMLEGIDWRNPQLTWRPKSAG